MSSSSGRESLLRETLASVHRATTSNEETVREAAANSLEEIARSDGCTLSTLQTWLDAFARTNGGSSPSEYAASDRVRLLRSLQRLLRVCATEGLLDDLTNVAHKACLSRIIALASEEMTKSSEIVIEVQEPCMEILLTVAEGNCVDRVTDSLLSKFQPGCLPHYFVVLSVSGLAQRRPQATVASAKSILVTTTAYIKNVKRDNLRMATTALLSKLSEAINEYLDDMEKAPDPSITREHFTRDVDFLHDVLFSSWLPKSNSPLKHAILESLGLLSSLLSVDRLEKQSAPLAAALVALYKKTSEPYHVTLCLSRLIGAAVLLVDGDKQGFFLDSAAEPLVTALFQQVAHHQNNVDYSRPLAMKNHFEVLRCYDALVRGGHRDKLVQGLAARANSMDENVRLAAMTILKHLVASSREQLEDRMQELVQILHGKLLHETSNKVRKMLAQLTAQLARLGYLTNEEAHGEDFLEFIVRLCALPPGVADPAPMQLGTSLHTMLGLDLNFMTLPPDLPHPSQVSVTNSDLRSMCDSILQLLAANVPEMEPLLWPKCLDFLLDPDLAMAAPAVVKCCSQLATKKSASGDEGDFHVEYGDFKFISGPYVLLSRLLVLAAVPFFESRGSNVLAFLQQFGPNINKHLPCLWKTRIPLLQHYLDTHGPHASPPPSWDQQQWEEWLLALLDDTVSEIGLEEWTLALAGAMVQQLNLYKTSETAPEKSFLLCALGTVLSRLSHTRKALISEYLSEIFRASTESSDTTNAGARSFGIVAGRHLNLVLEKLDSLTKSGCTAPKRSSSFFGLLRDSKTLGEEQVRCRGALLLCLGQAGRKASREEVVPILDQVCSKFIMPPLKGANTSLKVRALRAMSLIASTVQPPPNEFLPSTGEADHAPISSSLFSHHSDLVHESIDCLRDAEWTVSEKHEALNLLLELVRIPPYLPQATRCSLLKACFTALFQSVLRQTDPTEKKNNLTTRQQILEKLLLLVTELLRQDLRMSTLDEIFSLLEPWMQHENATAREMAMTLLKAVLETFLKGTVIGGPEMPSSFAPGPYMVGATLPRCFDASGRVQALGMKTLELLVSIMILFEGKDATDVDFEKLRTLCKESAMSPTSHTYTAKLETAEPPISSTYVSAAVNELLTKSVTDVQLLPLFHALIDSLGDEVPGSARGTAHALAYLSERRAHALPEAARPQLISNKLHAQLAAGLEGETRVLALSCARSLAASLPAAAARALLVDHPLPSDEAVESLWKVFACEPPLALSLLNYLLSILTSPASPPCSQVGVDPIHNRPRLQANHLHVSAASALTLLFSMREMESVLGSDSETATVLVPLSTSMACLLAVPDMEQSGKKKKKRTSVQEEEGRKKMISPFRASLGALHSYFLCRNQTSVASSILLFSSTSEDLATVESVDAFSEVFSRLVHALIQDMPLSLGKTLRGFRQMNSNNGSDREDVEEAEEDRMELAPHTRRGRLLAGLAFSAQLLQAAERSGVERYLREEALENVLSCEGEDDDDPSMRALCLNALSAYDGSYLLGGGAKSVLEAFLRAIGDDFKSGLNAVALRGLRKLLSARGMREHSEAESEVKRVMPEIIAKIRPFFDMGVSLDAQLAILCFSELSSFFAEDEPEAYLELFRPLCVSLLVHAGDAEEEGVRLAAREALGRGLKIMFAKEQVYEDLVIACYPTFLSTFCGSLSVSSANRHLLLPHLQAALAYLGGRRCLRAAAARLCSELVLACKPGSEENKEVVLEGSAVCKGLSTLLGGGEREASEVAAACLGRVLVHLRRLEDVHSDK